MKKANHRNLLIKPKNDVELLEFLKSLVNIEAKLKKQGFKMRVGRYEQWLYWVKTK